MNDVVAGGQLGFNDKASSVKYSVPSGWTLVLYDDYYSGKSLPLTGTGEISNLGDFGDDCTSLRWE